MTEIDFLTVLHNEKAVKLFEKHVKLFRSRITGKTKLNFKVSCDTGYKSLLPDKVEIVKYEKIPIQGAIDHAYNMHTLLNHVKTEWFCVMDPDVYPISLGWDEKVLRIMRDYEVFGIPYSSPHRFYDFPFLHLIFYKWNSFIKEINRHGLFNKKDRSWNIFMPITKPTSLQEVQHALREENEKPISRPSELSEDILLPLSSGATRELLNAYNKRYSCSRPSGPCPDTAWRTPLIFKALKALCLKESPINEAELDPMAGRGTMQSFKYSDPSGEALFAHLVYASNC
tara:strand:- start:1143 stop:1997 length:855 start_codon:yes stop_codon:yes gene_type:complete